METTYTKATNEYHEIKLTSDIIYAIWQKGIARGGAEIDLEVRTVFVGDGAPIKITVKGTESKKILTFKDAIFGNRFSATFPLPPDLKVEEELFFEVKLKDLGLNTISNSIPAFPMPELLSMNWDGGGSSG